MLLTLVLVLGVLVTVLSAAVVHLWVCVHELADDAAAAQLQGMALDVKVRQLMGGKHPIG